MNNINEILQVINELGGYASIEEITKGLCKKKKIMYDGYLKSIVLSTLNSNKKLVSFSNLTNKWNLGKEKNSNYLYVSDNKYFDTIDEAISYIFQMKAPIRKGYFKIKRTNDYAWFPKFDNANPDWTNILSDDGKTWRETPNTKEATVKEEERHLEDSKRYVFAFDKVGVTHKYRFTGVFKQTSIEDDGTRVYSLIDDKVALFSNKPKLMICNIGCMKYYKDITEDDPMLGGGGKYTTESKDGGEKYNFLPTDDGFTYGFVETNYIDNENHLGEPAYARKIHIENINPSFEESDVAEGVRVVFITKGPQNKKHVVVGWYDNATIFRNRQVRGETFGFNIKCSNSDAHLIPMDERDFEYVKKNEDGSFNFGQSNISYPYNNGEDSQSTEELANRLNEYIGRKLITTGFEGFLTQMVFLRKYESSSKQQYIQSLNQINDQLIGIEINNKIEDINDINLLSELRNRMLDKSTKVGQDNESRKNTWSATIGAYIEYLKALESSKPNIFFEPVNMLEYHMFDFINKPGDKETFLATSDMKIGDYLLLHVGSQDKNYESGIYGVVKIVSSPYIYHGEDDEHCNNNLSVDTEVVNISKEPLMTHNDFSKYVTQYRSRHIISDSFYKELFDYFKL